MLLPSHFILIKGEPKSLQIERIFMEQNGTYCVKFRFSDVPYHYRQSAVIWLRNGVWHDPQQCRVCVSGKIQTNVANLYSFNFNNETFWRIEYASGFVSDYADGSVSVEESCLTTEAAKNVLAFLTRVAQTNELGKEEDNDGILSLQYGALGIIGESCTLAPYLNPAIRIKQRKARNLIFPFGCNSSQEKAVAAAMSNQISVIQGPPGTGKTQTILNIIANILIQGKTVLIVSNNNAATGNVLEKLQKYGLDFMAASLGSNANKDEFIKKQPAVPDELASWKLKELTSYKRTISNSLSGLKTIFALQEELAKLREEQKTVELEWTHFQQSNSVTKDSYHLKKGVNSSSLLNLWLQYQAYAEKEAPRGFLYSVRDKVKWLWLNLFRKHRYGIKTKLDVNNLQTLILEIQALYYIARTEEISIRIAEIQTNLDSADVENKMKTLTDKSTAVLKNSLFEKYINSKRIVYSDRNELKQNMLEFLEQYPVVLSTTFAARFCTPKDKLYDYLIMDEASQVAIETGALALSCAENAVIVGDAKQLPNVVTEPDKVKLEKIFSEYKIDKGYNGANYSFLESVGLVLPDVAQTLLREHYRCHPKIINFCNQKFYGGNLVIMTEDNGEDNVMMAIKTVPGDHARGNYNQREIDVVKTEILPSLGNKTDVGIIAPYNDQVDAFNSQIPDVGAATVHKYQGKEKGTIIMSVVDNQIKEFTDNANLLNVAVSRAKKQFIIVLSGNKQEQKGNISDLVDYIEYNNCVVTDSKISSIFDYLYSYYTDMRLSYLKEKKNVSAYDSENLMYGLLTDILGRNDVYSHLEVLCHIPVRNIIHDFSLLNEAEVKYVSHYSTHIDFLIVNRVSKKPVLAIETDGYNFHNDQTLQHQRDVMKNHILELYGLPLLRLSTVGSGERCQVMDSLNAVLD